MGIDLLDWECVVHMFEMGVTCDLDDKPQRSYLANQAESGVGVVGCFPIWADALAMITLAAIDPVPRHWLRRG